MNAALRKTVVITGVGMVTPLGKSPAEIVRRIRAGDSAAAAPAGFDAGPFACPACAEIKDFEPHRYVSEAKMARLMNRDAQLAVAAARLALEDAGVRSGITYPPEEIALFGATGLAGLPLREVAPLIRVSASSNGQFDLARFGQAGLKAVSPILSFKILSNMPLCFVSMNENIQGPNAIYSSWEGEGAQAIEAGIRALEVGDARCALVGGCEVKTHELAFATLEQLGLFEGWKRRRERSLGAPACLPGNSENVKRAGRGAGAPSIVPGEGAAFLVLETERDALARRAHPYGCLRSYALRCHGKGEDITEARRHVLKALNIHEAEALVSAADGGEGRDRQETALLEAAGVSVQTRICPKKQVGDLFAAAGLLQVAIGAALTDAGAKTALVNCFGHGSTQAAFVLEKAETRRQGCRRSQ